MMKKNRNISTEHRKIRKIRINALTVWIALEIAVLVMLASVIAIRQMYGIRTQTQKNYTLPTEEVPDLSITDIERPTDLTGQESAQEETVVVEEAESTPADEEIKEDVVVADPLAGMDAKQKVDMLLITTPEALCDRVNVTIAGDIFKQSYSEDMVSGLMFKESNFKSEEAGKQMLSAIHSLSKELTGEDILISYRGEITDMKKLADRGVNLYCFPPDAENAAALTESAIQNNIIPAFLVSLKDVAATEPATGLYVAETDNVDSVVEAINAGRNYLYMAEDYKTIRDGLVQAVSYRTITPEAIDNAVEFALTVRRSQANMSQEADNR